MKDLHGDKMLGSAGDRLRRFEEAPSEELWGRIVGDLEEPREVLAPVWPLWLESSSLGAIVVIFLLGLGGDVLVSKQVSVQEKNAIPERRLENQANAQERSENLTTVDNSPEILAPTQNFTVAPTSDPKLQTPGPDDQSPIANTQSPIPNTQSSTSNPQSKTDTTLQIITDNTITPPYKKPKSKFQLYISVNPSLSFQKIIPAHDNIIIEGLEHRSPLSPKRFGFAIDAGFQRNINKIFGYYGGINFYHQQQELTYQYFDRDADVNRIGDSWTTGAALAFEINRPQHTHTFSYNMTNIGLRSGILVTLKGEKLQHKFGAGLIYSHGLIKSNDSYNNSQSSYLSYQLFYRNEIRINERLSWFIEPTFIYSFVSKEKLEEPFKLKPYRAGISGGVLYRF
jgi:hypothetical protein